MGKRTVPDHALATSSSLEVEVRRVARELLEDSVAALAAPLGATVPLAHRLRRNNKKLFALLVLTRQALGERAYSTERDALRATSAVLAAPRRAAVMLEALAELQSSARGSYAPLLRRLAEAHEARTREAFEPLAIAELRRRLHETLDRVERWSLAGLDGETLLTEFGAAYSRARKRFEQASERPSSRRLHRLRKWTKVHFYQIRLVAPLLNGSSSNRAKRADSLGEHLGREHDLSELAEIVSGCGREILTEDVLDELNEEIRTRRARLRRRCLRAGRRLFEIKARALVGKYETTLAA